MTKASTSLQELRRKIYRKAKTEKHRRFWGICKKEVLQEAYRLAKANDGVPGIDHKSFEDIKDVGVEGFLEGIRQELLNRTYKPMPNKRVKIPKGKGKTRMLGIPTVKDRVVQGALSAFSPHHHPTIHFSYRTQCDLWPQNHRCSLCKGRWEEY